MDVVHPLALWALWMIVSTQPEKGNFRKNTHPNARFGLVRVGFPYGSALSCPTHGLRDVHGHDEGHKLLDARINGATLLHLVEPIESVWCHHLGRGAPIQIVLNFFKGLIPPKQLEQGPWLYKRARFGAGHFWNKTKGTTIAFGNRS